jgi:hypothetical protein
MKLLEVMYYINVVIIIIETIGMYMYNSSKLWLGIMSISMATQVFCVYIQTKKKRAQEQSSNI